MSCYSSCNGHDHLLATLEAHVSKRQRFVFSCALIFIRGAQRKLIYVKDGQISCMRVTALHRVIIS